MNQTTIDTDRATDSRATGSWWLIVFLIVAGFAVCTFGALRLATYSGWQDTEAYLGHSLYIAEHGGFFGFLRASFAGTFPITERHPLYMLLLAPFASRTPAFFWTAKVIDLIFGIVVLVTFIWMVERRYGKGPAAIAGTLYALSQSLLVASSHVNHETPFALCTLWTWWFLTQPERARAESAHDDMPASAARWAMAGAWLGLAYLVKSPASLMGVAIAVAGLCRLRLRFLLGPRLWALLLATALVSSPLLVRNWRGYGKLVYEGVNTNILWLDRWVQLGGEHSVMYYDHYGIKTIEKNGLPTAKDYLRKHGPAAIAARLGKGFLTETLVVARKAVSPAFPLPKPIAAAWGFAALAFAAAGWWMRRRSWEATFAFFWSAAFLIFFGWNKLFPEFRYLAPLVPVWLAYAGYAIWRLKRRFLTEETAWRVEVVKVSAVMLIAVGYTTASGALTKPVPVIAASPAYQHLIAWMNRTIEPGDRILVGPSEEFYGLIWTVERPVSVIQAPDVRTLDAFLRYLRERKVRYVVLHPQNAYGWGGQLAQALTPYVAVTPQGQIVEKKPLPGWRQVFADPGTPQHFLIYESEAVRPMEKR